MTSPCPMLFSMLIFPVVLSLITFTWFLSTAILASVIISSDIFISFISLAWVPSEMLAWNHLCGVLCRVRSTFQLLPRNTVEYSASPAKNLKTLSMKSTIFGVKLPFVISLKTFIILLLVSFAFYNFFTVGELRTNFLIQTRKAVHFTNLGLNLKN